MFREANGKVAKFSRDAEQRAQIFATLDDLASEIEDWHIEPSSPITSEAVIDEPEIEERAAAPVVKAPPVPLAPMTEHKRDEVVEPPAVAPITSTPLYQMITIDAADRPHVRAQRGLSWVSIVLALVAIAASAAALAFLSMR